MSNEMITKLNELSHEFKSAIERSDTAATDRLNDAISDLESKMKAMEIAANRPTIEASAEDLQVKSAFNAYLRGGDTTEIKAMSAIVLSEGGYTVPKQIDSAIQKALVDISPMRSLARVLNVSTADFRIPFSPGGTVSSWVGEKAARPETAASTITEIAASFGELYASPFVTPVLLEDSQFDIESFIASEVATEFARAEGAAFLNGDGTNKPKGLLTMTTALTGDSTRAYGTVQHVTSGNATDIVSADKLIELVHALKAGYRNGAKFIMSKDTLAKVRKLKDSTSQYLWQPSLQAGNASTLLGYEVVEAEDMPAVSAGSLSIAFGNFQNAYTICDRIGVSILRDPYSNAPYVAYKTRKRVGGLVVDTAAYKLLKTGA